MEYIYDDELAGCSFRIHRRIGYRYYNIFGEFLRQNYRKLREIGEPFSLAHRFMRILREDYLIRYEVRGRIRYRVRGRVCTYLEIQIISKKTYMEFIYTYTFVETGKSIVSRRFWRNKRTGEIIKLRRGRPPIGLSRILNEWERKGELEYVEEREARKIEIHFESEIRPEFYEEMKDKIAKITRRLVYRGGYGFIYEVGNTAGEPESWSEGEIEIKKEDYVEARFEIYDHNYGVRRAETPWVAMLPLEWWELDIDEIVDYF